MAKEDASLEKRLRKQWKELYGEELQPTPTKRSEASIEADRAAQERGNISLIDKEPLR
jgi:hypothetical protein